MTEEKISMTTCPQIVSKYDAAAKIANEVLEELAMICHPRVSVVFLCMKGDALIKEKLEKVYNNKKEIDAETKEKVTVDKGIAFPTCVSINNCICHFSPLQTDNEVLLQAGDIAKIDLGVQIGGYSVVAAQSVVVGGTNNQRIADVLLAAHYSAEAAHRMLRPGTKSEDITRVVQKIAESYNCKPIEGMLSHNLLRGKVDGDKGIIQNPNEQQLEGHTECVIEEGDVFAMDVVLSTGSGVAKLGRIRPSIYKLFKPDKEKSLETLPGIELKATMEIDYPSSPFNLRWLPDEQSALKGISEVYTAGYVEPFHILFDDPGQYVSHLKFTAFVTKNATRRATSSNLDVASLKSEYSITDEEVLEILARPLPLSKKSMKAQKRKEN